MTPNEKLDLLKNISIKNALLNEVYKPRFHGDVKTSLNPSSASLLIHGKNLDYVVGACLRETYYKMNKVPVTNQQQAYYRFMQRMGDMVEDFTIQALRETGLLNSPGIFDRQPALWDPELQLSGFLDGIIEDIDGNLFLLEVKSFYGEYAHKQFEGYMQGRKPNTKWIRGEPKPEHLMQASIYLYHFRELLKGGKLFYFSRDDAAQIEFNLVLNQNNQGQFTTDVDGHKNDWLIIDHIFERYDLLRHYVDNKELPPRDYILEFSKDELEARYEESKANTYGPGSHLVYKTKYDKAIKSHNSCGKTYLGDWRCKGCEYQTLCWT